MLPKRQPRMKQNERVHPAIISSRSNNRHRITIYCSNGSNGCVGAGVNCIIDIRNDYFEKQLAAGLRATRCRKVQNRIFSIRMDRAENWMYISKAKPLISSFGTPECGFPSSEFGAGATPTIPEADPQTRQDLRPQTLRQ